ncbi:MAG TPA: glycosyltransferase [Gaiellaceae bacterium]|nr:glycosyltransferase [Gaiellaceae bacterium]
MRNNDMLDLSVVVPTRNAETMIGECLEAILRSSPRETLVVDGLSTDATLEIARRYPVRILSDEGRGLPAARLIGAEAARSSRVALVDVDVVLFDGALRHLLAEFEDGEYAALQAGLDSVSGPGYWGRALADHHRSGRSKHWFGLVATIFDRATLLEYGFDARFLSGEDVELRYRLEQAGARIGVSRETVVTHRFGDTFDFAKGQWLADGHGHGRMIRKHGARGWRHALIPLAATGRGIVLSALRRQPQWMPYYLCFLVFNYLGVARELTAAAKGEAR